MRKITPSIKKKLLKEALSIVKTAHQLPNKNPSKEKKLYDKLDKKYDAFEKHIEPYITDDAADHIHSIPKYDEYDDLIDDLKFMFSHKGDVN